MDKAAEGLNLEQIDSISEDEKNASLMQVWSWRGPLYEMSVMSLMLDYGGPAFAKMHRRASQLFGRPSHSNIILLSCSNIHSYMMLGFETGIRNEFLCLRRNGLAMERTMELVMFSQLYAGMRGLGHVYQAVGDFLPAMSPPDEPSAVFPDGWAADSKAFESGIDFTDRAVSSADQSNLLDWYERSIGYVPTSISFGLKYHPEFIKANRGKWEMAIRTLPKQIAPYLMLRHAVIVGSEAGVKEAASLARNWGISRDLIVHCVMSTAMYFTSFEGLYAPGGALDSVLENW